MRIQGYKTQLGATEMAPELHFSKNGKDKELEVRMIMANKDWEAMKLIEDNAFLWAAARY
ncbi:hypothetical protein BY996DRAFT_6485467 [Phakopsora pachyrhizi]|nr:hypothetical protein BY996DRAFT_6485467 [Phakopsora pachyrhizi]